MRSLRLAPSAELSSFMAIGALCTAAYALLYTLLRHGGMSPAAANALSLLSTMGANFAANRRYTFEGAARGPLGRQVSAYGAAYLLGLAVSSVMLALLLSALGHPQGALDTAAGVTAGVGATAVRYRLMRSWVFASRSRSMVLRPELVLLLVLAAVLNLWALSRNGWANDYYSAAVRSMSTSWHNFLYDSFDPSGVMTVDKPPLSLWVQALSVRVFGFHSLSILVPQALMGVGSVALLYDLVRRRFGRIAGFVAGVVLALTPISVAMSRHNNPDALLVLCCVAALWFTVRGLEDGRTRWIVLAGVAVGLGFETKMMEAMLVVPGIVAAWLWIAPRGRLTALRQLLAGGTATVVVGGAWPLLMTLTPASSRPWISGTSDNNIWSLIFGYNGLGRLDGQAGGPGGGRPGGGSLVFGGSAGPLRLLGTALGGQDGWLLGVALVGGAGLLLATRLRRSDARTGWLLATGGAFLTTAVAFSFAQGIFHPYYVSLLAPFLAALVGATAGHVLSGGRMAHRAVAPLAILGGLVTELVVLHNESGTLSWLPPLLIAIAVIAATALAFGETTKRLRVVIVAAALFALLLAPASWAVDTLGHPTSSTFPAGGPAATADNGGPGGARLAGGAPANGLPGGGAPPRAFGGGFPGGGAPPQAGGGFAGGGAPFGGTNGASLSAVERYVNAHGGGTIAVSSQTGASAAIITSGAKVAGVGGFSGRESEVSVRWLAQAVRSGKVRWVLVDAGAGGLPQDTRVGASKLMAAVAKVGRKATTTSGGTLYDLAGRADALLVAAG